MNWRGSKYFEVVIWTVAVVPKLILAQEGSRQPTPNVSQPLSDPAAITGVPSLIPVAEAA